MINKRFEELANKLLFFFRKLGSDIALSEQERKEFEDIKKEINQIDIDDIIVDDEET